MRRPGLAGADDIGGGPEGLARAPKTGGRRHEVVFVGHGLTCGLPVVRATDAVSTQNPPATLMDRIAILADLGAGRPATQGSERPRTEIALREGPPEHACRSADID